MAKETSSSSRGWTIARRWLVGFAAIITLIALFYLEEDVRGRLEWRAYKAKATARGVEFDRHAVEPAPVPDDQNFATTPFLAPLRSIWNDLEGYTRVTTFGSNFFTITAASGGKYLDSSHLDIETVASALAKKSGAQISNRNDAAREILAATDEYKPVLDELREASKRPYSRFNIHYDDADPTRILLPHLAQIKKIASMVSYRASSELALGRNDAAIDDVGFLIRLANSSRTEPFMISQLVRIAMLNMAQQIIWEGLNNRAWSDAQLLELQKQLENLNVLKDAELGVRGEHAEHASALFDLMRNKPESLAEDLQLDGPALLMLRLMPSGWIYLEQVSYNRIFDEQILNIVDVNAVRIPTKDIEKHMDELQKILRQSPVETIFHHHILASFLIPSVNGYYLKVAFCQTMMDEAAIACALERYRLAHAGHYPESLAVLTPDFMAVLPHDVTTGEPLKYSAGNDSYILYSVGWNEKDDDGQPSSRHKPNSPRDYTQGDWVWQSYQ